MSSLHQNYRQLSLIFKSSSIDGSWAECEYNLHEESQVFFGSFRPWWRKAFCSFSLVTWFLPKTDLAQVHCLLQSYVDLACLTSQSLHNIFSKECCLLCLDSGHSRVLISTVEMAVVHFKCQKESTKCHPAVSQEEKAHGSTRLDRLREDSSMIQTRKTKIVSSQEHEHTRVNAEHRKMANR